MKQLRNQNGFSLLELILALLVGGIVIGVSSQTLVSNVDSYSFITNRKAALGDVRYAINRISHELLRIGESDLQNIDSTRIDFYDSDGTLANFRLGTNGANLGLFRGSDLLVDRVSTFSLEYYDGDGNVVSPTSGNETLVKRIKMTITTEPKNDEGSITLSTVVTPRVFIGYSNYQ